MPPLVWVKFLLMLMNALFSIADVHRARRFLREGRRGFDYLGLRGQVTELASSRGYAGVTQAVELIAQAQAHGEPVAWIGSSSSLFYPPAARGWELDWSALALIQLQGVYETGRAADRLLRSGGFGLVIVDLVAQGSLPAPLLGRLHRLSKTHECALVFLTCKKEGEPSLSALIPLRVQVCWRAIDPWRLLAHIEVVKDKSGGRRDRFERTYDGPLSLR